MGSRHHQKPVLPREEYFTAKIAMLLQQAPFVGYWSRQKFVGPCILGLIKSRNVPFDEVAQHRNDAAKPASNETRIQDFFGKLTQTTC